MQINTGEGKSITTAMLSVLQWVQEGTVLVGTKDSSLIEQDYNEQGNHDFFDSVGIPSAVVRSDSPKGTIQLGGINYTTIKDISLYRSRAKIRGESLQYINKDGKEKPFHLVLDECDYSTLDDRTLFNYADYASSADEDADIDYPKIYTLINEFIDKPEFRIDRPEEGWSSEDDVLELRKFLGRNNVPESYFTTKELSNWIDEACEVHLDVFKEGTENSYQLELNKDGTARAIPLQGGVLQDQSLLDGTRHQFLHARLQKKFPDYKFPIAEKLSILASESAKGFVDSIRDQNGRIVGITGTAGINAELIEQESKFGMRAIEIPPHNPQNRSPLAPKINTIFRNAIVDAINDASLNEKGEPQPILMIAKDPSSAKAIFNRLKSQYGDRLQCITTAEELKQGKEKARKPGTITIATKIAARGTDIDPEHDEGLYVIPLDLDTARETRQIIGRCARNGKVGKYRFVYELNGLPFYHSLTASDCQNQAIIERMQHTINEEAAVQRYFIQEVDGLQQVLLKQFDAWRLVFRDMTTQSNYDKLDKELLKHRESIISQVKEAWKARVEASDPEKKYPNPFIRREDKSGELDTTQVKQGLKAFETEDIPHIWDGVLQEIKRMKKAVEKPDEAAALRASYMEKMDIRDDLNAKKLNLRATKKREKEIQKRGILYAEMALDEDKAMLTYGSDALSAEEISARKINSDKKHVDRMISHFTTTNDNKKLGMVDLAVTDDSTAQEKIIALKDALVHLQDDEKVDEMQSVLVEFLEHANSMEAPAEGDNWEDDITGLKSKLTKSFAAQVASDLLEELEWANPNKTYLIYHVQYAEVQSAARELWEKANAVAASKEPEKQLKELYKALHEYKIQLKHVESSKNWSWFWSWFWPDPNKVITQSINDFSTYKRVFDMDDDLQQTKEEKLVSVYLSQFNTLMERYNLEYKELNDWNEFYSKIKDKIGQKWGLSVIYEIRYILECERDKLMHPPNDLIKPVQALFNELKAVQGKAEQEQPTAVKNEAYLSRKEEELLAAIKQLHRIESSEETPLVIRRGQTGFNDYIEVEIYGPVLDEDCFPGFTRHQSTQYDECVSEIEELEIERADLQTRLTPSLDYINQTKALKKNIMNGVLPVTAKFLTLVGKHFPPDIQAKINDANEAMIATILKHDSAKRELDDVKTGNKKLSWFTSFSTFEAGKIAEIEDCEKEVKIHKRDWITLKTDLVKSYENRCSAEIQQHLDTIKQLTPKIETIDKKLVFLKSFKESEEQRSSKMVRRFETISDFLSYQAELEEMCQEAEENLSIEGTDNASVSDKSIRAAQRARIYSAADGKGDDEDRADEDNQRRKSIS